LRFYIDGSQKNAISGSVNWNEKEYELPAGQHTLKWAYTKDGSVSRGSDMGWVDSIKLINYESAKPSIIIRNEQENFWWDCSWKHKNRLDILETSGENIKDYQSALKINTQSLISQGKMRSDCSDIRFIENNSEIPYYLESGCNTQDTKIWLKTSLSANQIKTIYLYYGNLGTESDSNPCNVFDLYEPWESGTLDTKWQTGGNKPFVISTTSYEGLYSSGNGDIGDSQSSYMQTTVNLAMPAKVTFYWKVYSEGYYDYLRFYVDGVQKNAISGTVNWNKQEYEIPAGQHTLKWAYTKDGSVSRGSDMGGIDLIKIHKMPPIQIGESKIDENWESGTIDETWQTGGNKPFAISTTAYEGYHSVGNGDIGNSQSSYIQTTVDLTNPGKATFYWKVSSEYRWDYLRFYIDGVQKNAISGSVDWNKQEYDLAKGTHTLKWTYTKDGSVSSGSDTGWIDAIEVIEYEFKDPVFYMNNVQINIETTQSQSINDLLKPEEITFNMSIENITQLNNPTEKISKLPALNKTKPGELLYEKKLRGELKEKLKVNKTLGSIRIIVKFKENATLTDIKKVKGKKLSTKLVSKVSTHQEIEQLLKNENIESIEEDVRVTTLMEDSYSTINYTFSFVDAEFNGSGIMVAVIDTGILHNTTIFPNLMYEYDFVEDDNYAQDENGHGTHVSSILASNSEPMGISPGVTLIPVRVLDSSGGGYVSDVISGINYAAEQNASVISMSLGATESPILTETVNDVIKNYKVTVIAAAGNYGPNSGTITSPGDAEYAITVGAIDNNNTIAGFSSRGPINGISKPDVVAPGVNIVTYSINGMKTMSGTSMATPFVSGLAALLLQQNDSRTPDEIKGIITDSATKLNYDVNAVGSGKINIGRALSGKYENNEGEINETNNETKPENETTSNANYRVKTINATSGDVLLIDYKITNPLKESAFNITFKGINESWVNWRKEITIDSNETVIERAVITIPLCVDTKTLNMTIATNNEIGIGYTGTVRIYVEGNECNDIGEKKEKVKKITGKLL